MAIAKTTLSKDEKKALKLFCKENSISEADLLRKMIRQVARKQLNQTEQKRAPTTLPTEGSLQMNLRLTPGEMRKVIDRRKREGFSKRTAWAVSVIRQALNSTPALSQSDIQVLRESNRELAAIGRNLNQVAHAINIDPRHGDKVTPELFEALTVHIQSHRSKTSRVLDASLNRWGLVNE